jgi:hypothetical protein
MIYILKERNQDYDFNRVCIMIWTRFILTITFLRSKCRNSMFFIALTTFFLLRETWLGIRLTPSITIELHWHMVRKCITLMKSCEQGNPFKFNRLITIFEYPTTKFQYSFLIRGVYLSAENTNSPLLWNPNCTNFPNLLFYFLFQLIVTNDNIQQEELATGYCIQNPWACEYQ